MSPPHIVIVGGGAAGLMLATRLGRRLGRRGSARISLVDRQSAHVWKPMLHTIAAGTRDLHHQQIGFLAHARDHGFSFEPGELQALDRRRRVIGLAGLRSASGEEVVPPRSLHYDALVLALGSGANDFGLPGVREHCHFIDSQPQAEAFNAALRLRLLRGALQNEEVRIGIVGGGASGVELAAELSHLLEVAAAFGDPALRERLQLTLYESAPRVLAAFPERMSTSSQQVLDRLGFKVRTGARVVGADAGGVMLAAEGHQPADLTVWAAGVQAPAVMARLDGLAVNAARQLVVRENLMATDDDRIFAIGDCASLVPAGRERPLPASAQVAGQQAMHLDRHLSRWLLDGRMPPFVHRDLGALVSLGAYDAFGALGRAAPLAGSFLRGRIAQLGHAWLYRRHQIAVHGWGRAGLRWLEERVHRLSHPGVRLC